MFSMLGRTDPPQATERWTAARHVLACVRLLYATLRNV